MEKAIVSRKDVKKLTDSSEELSDGSCERDEFVNEVDTEKMVAEKCTDEVIGDMTIGMMNIIYLFVINNPLKCDLIRLCNVRLHYIISNGMLCFHRRCCPSSMTRFELQPVTLFFLGRGDD